MSIINKAEDNRKDKQGNESYDCRQRDSSSSCPETHQPQDNTATVVKLITTMVVTIIIRGPPTLSYYIETKVVGVHTRNNYSPGIYSAIQLVHIIVLL